MKVDLSKYDEDFEHLETAIRHKQKSRNRLKNNNRDPNRRKGKGCLLYTSPSPRDGLLSRMPSSA